MESVVYPKALNDAQDAPTHCGHCGKAITRWIVQSCEFDADAEVCVPILVCPECSSTYIIKAPHGCDCHGIPAARQKRRRVRRANTDDPELPFDAE